MKKGMVWETIKCRCGAMRGRGDSCGDCGYEPRLDDVNEVNRHVVQRRQAVKVIDDLVARELEQSVMPPTFEKIVETFPEDFIHALTELGNEETVDGAAVLMGSALTRLERARLALEPFSGLRPFAMERAQLEVLSQLSAWWPIYREAITSADIGVAQKKADEGQATVDASAKAISEIRPVLDALELVGDYQSESSLTKRQILALQTKYPDAPMSALEDFGGRTLSEELGATFPNDVGLQHLMLKVLAEAVFLPESFTKKTQELAALWKDKEQRVGEIARMTHSVDDLADVAAHLTEAFLQFDQAVQNATSSRGVVRAATKLMGHLYEDAQPLWTWNILLRGTSTAVDKYSKTAATDSTVHIRKLASALPRVCEDAEVFYRNASHHGASVRPDDDGEHVVLSTRSGGERRLTTNQYIDRLYALTESVIAMHWVAHLFLAVYNIVPPSRSDMPSGFGMTARDEAFFVIEVRLGCAVHRNEIVHGIWQVQADLPPENVLEVAVALATTIGPEVEWLELESSNHSGPLPEISPAYVRDLLTANPQASSSMSESQSVLNLLRYKDAITLDGATLLSDDDIRWATAALGFQLLSDKDSVQAQSPRLRVLKKWAELRELKDATSNITAVMRSWRSNDPEEIDRETRRLASILRTLPKPEIPALSGLKLRASEVAVSRTTHLIGTPIVHVSNPVTSDFES